MDINQLLVRYDNARVQLDAQQAEYQNARKSILAKVQDELDELEIEMMPILQEMDTGVSEIETALKAAVIEHGATVKDDHWQAVYTKGRVTWDGKKLDGMMSLIPQLADARKEGEPSVSIRAVK